ELRGLVFKPMGPKGRDGVDVESASPASNLQFLAQGHQDQFIAEMAQWGMPRTKTFNVAGRDYTFEDFIRYSKARASTTQKQELSWAIIIIGQFYGTDVSWINKDGDQLHYNDVVRYELDQPINEAACGGTHRLFGLTWAYHLHMKNGGKK